MQKGLKTRVVGQPPFLYASETFGKVTKATACTSDIARAYSLVHCSVTKRITETHPLLLPDIEYSIAKPHI